MMNYPYPAGGGGPVGGTYTGGTVGSTIPGQQFQNTQSLIAQGNSQMASGTPFTPEMAQATQNAYDTANANYVSESTPMARQDVLGATNLGAMQGNYNNLAQKLAAYDNMVLKPEFEGQNPGMPTDLPYNPDIYMGNVSYLTPQSAKLPYSQGIYNANPAYAISAQTTQRNSIIDVLNTLNDAMTKELGRGKDIYGSRLKTAAATLQGLGDLLRMNSDLEQKRADLETRRMELAASRADKNQAKFSDLTALADKLVDDLATGKAQWGDAFNTVKSYAKRMGVGVTDQEIDTLLKGSYNWADPSKSTGWAREGAAQEYAQGLRFKQTGSADAKQQAMAKIGVNVINSLDTIPSAVMNSTGSPTALSAYTKLSKNIFGIPLAGALTKQEQEQANLESKYFALVQAALTAIQGSRPSDYDVKSYQQKLGPSIANPPQVNQDRINNLISLMGIQGQVTFGQGGSSGGSVLMTGPDGKKWNVPSDKVELFKQNGYK